MSRTLNLIGAGWASARFATARGQRSEALTRATRLLARPDLPPSIALEAHRLAGELLLEAEKYPRARRHLRAAVALAPAHAQTIYLLGLAHERDPQGCDHRAARCFRVASNLEPGNPTYRAAFGRAAIRCDRIKRGVRELLASADAAPGNVAVIRVVTEGLLEAGRRKAARRVLNRAFLCFENTNDRELVALWERVRFESARCAQRETTRHRQDAELARDGGRVVLPFVRVVAEKETPRWEEETDSVRCDVLSLPRPHFPRMHVRRADR